MNRRQYLTELGGVAGLVLLAGCSQLGGDNEGNTEATARGTANGSDGENSDGDGESGGTGGSSGNAAGTNTDEDTAATDEAGLGEGNGSDEALETGRAPPEETGTPFENTPTVPEEDGLETGSPPNTTSN